MNAELPLSEKLLLHYSDTNANKLYIRLCDVIDHENLYKHDLQLRESDNLAVLLSIYNEKINPSVLLELLHISNNIYQTDFYKIELHDSYYTVEQDYGECNKIIHEFRKVCNTKCYVIEFEKYIRSIRSLIHAICLNYQCLTIGNESYIKYKIDL